MLRYFSALLLLLLVKDSNSFIQPGGTVQGREPFRSQKAPAGEVNSYVIVLVEMRMEIAIMCN